jgi:hypothetical protein
LAGAWAGYIFEMPVTKVKMSPATITVAFPRGLRQESSQAACGVIGNGQQRKVLLPFPFNERYKVFIGNATIALGTHINGGT